MAETTNIPEQSELQDSLPEQFELQDNLPEQFRDKVVLKVSKIINVEQHPGGTMLYILTLDCGDEEPRQIVSSIVPFYKPEELQDKHIVMVYNLKPANFRGVRSNGMLLAASEAADEEHETCEVLFAPDFAVGTQLEPEGLEPPQEKLCYVKPDKFFSFPLITKDGFVELAGKKELEELQARFPNKKFDLQRGDSRLEDGSMMFWWITSEKI